MDRKECPIFSGLIKYFPKALREVSHISYMGNEQHNKGEPLHWARDKSPNELDSMMRHLVDYADGQEFDEDGTRILAKVCWRGLAMLQKELEK